jgi:hypothetical protein
VRGGYGHRYNVDVTEFSPGAAKSVIRGVPSRWLGAAHDLGLEVEWRAAFVDAGQRVTAAPDTVVVDVGGDLCAGVIDHHAESRSACSAAALAVEHADLIHTHLVAPWIEETRHRDIRGIRWRPTVVTHRNPDFDAIAAVAIIRQLVEHGDLPPWCHALAAYSTEVDQGRHTLRVEDGSLELYTLVLMLSELSAKEVCALASSVGPEPVGGPDAARLLVGLQLVSLWIDALPIAGATALGGFRGTRLPSDHPVVARLSGVLQEDLRRFLLARDEGHVHLLADGGLVTVPARDRAGVVRIRAAASVSADERHRSACAKHFLRSGRMFGARVPLTVIRLPAIAEDRNRWIIAVDPNGEGRDASASLRGLGISLEVEEERRRGGIGGAGNASRLGVARFEFAPGIADPWYDGRGHQFTIVDSPREGTVLDEADILRVLSSRFWEPEVSECTFDSWHGDGQGPVNAGALVPPGQFARLEELVEFVDGRRGKLGASNVLMAVNCSERWGFEPIARAARRVAGAGAREIELDGLRAFVGSQGVFLHSDGGIDPRVLNGIRAEMQLAESLVRHLRRVDREIAGGTAHDGAAIRTTHVRRVAEYYHGLGQHSSPEALKVAAALAHVHAIEQRVRGIGELLERLDDVGERLRGTQLNLIVVVLGLAGLLQVLAAAIDLMNVREEWPWAAWAVAAMTVGLLVVMLVVATGRGRRFLLRVRWIRELVGGG